MDLDLITNRTQADVDRVAALAARVSTGTATAAEKTEWATDLKGAYNASDLNRVGAAVAYVAGRLNGYGYAVAVSPKQDWTVSDIPTAGDMETYISDGQHAAHAGQRQRPDLAGGQRHRENLDRRGRAADPHGGGVVLFRRLVRRGSVKE